MQQRGSAPGDSVAAVDDILQWLRFYAGTHLFTDPGSVFGTALMSPTKSITFKAAEQFASRLPAPHTQWPTIAATAWESWPAVEMTLVSCSSTDSSRYLPP